MDRQFPKPRKIRRSAPLGNSAFFDANESDIVRACLVSRKTALDWMAGRKRPSDRSLKLFHLCHDQRVLTDAWRGWRVSELGLFSPDGWRFRPGQLQAAYWPGLLCHHCGARIPIHWQGDP